MSTNGPKVQPGLSTAAVCRLANVAPTTLNYWAAAGLVTPQLVGSAGRRNPRIWSARDLVVIKAIKALREAGCPLQRVRLAQSKIKQAWHKSLSELVLYWDGDLLAVDEWGNVISLLQPHPGQQLLHLVAVPLGPWAEAAMREASKTEYPVTEMLARRRAKADRSPTETVRLRA